MSGAGDDEPVTIRSVLREVWKSEEWRPARRVGRMNLVLAALVVGLVNFGRNAIWDVAAAMIVLTLSSTFAIAVSEQDIGQ